MKHIAIIRSIFAAVVALAATMTTMAETETVGGYTWTYRINGDTAEIYAIYSSYTYTPCISPSPTGAVTSPSTLGGKTVTSIGAGAFYNCSGLTSITIPDGVTTIGANAFTGCSGLTSITIPNSVTSIKTWAFEDCSGLTSVVIGDGVTNIEEGAFEGCSRLTSVTIPDSVTSLASDCFERCPVYLRRLYQMVWGVGGGDVSPTVVTTVVHQVVTTIVQQVESSYALTNSAADRAIASVTVDRDCAIDEFVLKDGKVYDSMIYVNNTAEGEVKLSLPEGYSYKTFTSGQTQSPNPPLTCDIISAIK